MESCIANLDLVIQKLVCTAPSFAIDLLTHPDLKDKQFKKMNREIDNLEALMIEAEKAKGAKWVNEEPLWCTWSLEKFGQCSA